MAEARVETYTDGVGNHHKFYVEAEHEGEHLDGFLVCVRPPEDGDLSEGLNIRTNVGRGDTNTPGSWHPA